MDYFTMHLVDLEEARHDTKVSLWKSTNEVIEGQLESLKLLKVQMKVEIQELNSFIRQLATPLASIFAVSITKDPTTTNVQALISQLQEDKHFGQIDEEWIEKVMVEGLSIIDYISNVILKFQTQKDNITSNRATLAIEKAKSDDYVSLLKMIIQMKIKKVVEANIFPKEDEPIVEWFQSM